MNKVVSRPAQDKALSEATPGMTQKTSSRTNSRRGHTNPLNRSYPPVHSACRTLQVLKVANEKCIVTVNSINARTGIPRSSVVRILETLMHEGYVVRDNMCGGYRVTQKVAELSAGCSGISRVIETARPLAIGLTRQTKWPIGLGVIDGDAIEILYWTGTISPVVHTNTVLGLRPDLLTSAMGRAYMAFCEDDERERHIARMRQLQPSEFGAKEEAMFRQRLKRARNAGYATRDPRTEPLRMTTFGVPIIEREKVAAVMSLSFFTSSMPTKDVKNAVLKPLIETRLNMEHALAFISERPRLDASVRREYDVNV
jgi:IclR family transcriptional regulator, mhp operon transcriptional activator